MNRFKRPLAAWMLFALLLYFGLPVVSKQSEHWIKRYQSEKRETSELQTSSLVYTLKSGDWISFSLPPGTEKIRVISNAHLPPELQLLPDQTLKYSFRYQLIDTHGAILVDQTYHHRTKLTRYLNESSKQIFGNYYLGYPETPLDGRLMLLSMNTIQSAATVRISYIQQTPEIESVALRLYIPDQLQEQQLVSTWLRMSLKNRQKLAHNTAYPPSLLTAEEKRNLLQNQWQVVGPNGIQGRDYHSRTLYILKELEQERILEPVIASGLQMEPGRPGIIPIPEHGGELSIHLTHHDGSPFQKPMIVRLDWFGRTRDQHWSRNQLMLADGSAMQLQVQGGLLQLHVEQGAVARVELSTLAGELLDITPAPLIISTYQASQGIEYDILHVDQRSTPLRMDVRKLVSEDDEDNTSALQFQWLSDDDQVVYQDILSVPQQPSMYDRLTARHKHFSVTDPVSYYFNLPPEVSRLRVQSGAANVIINAYNQPQPFRKIQRVPENAFVSLDKYNWFPSWFQLRAVNHQQLTLNNALFKIAGQYRPPDIETEQKPDRYLWQDFKPLQQTQAHLVLASAEAESYRDQALPGLFCQITANRSLQVELGIYGKRQQINPQLIYFRNDTTPFQLDLELDGQIRFTSELAGDQGIISLPPLPTGQHRLRLITKGGGRFYLNYRRHCDSEQRLKRRVYRLSDNVLSFDVINDQVQDRILSGRIYSAGNDQQRSVLDVDIEPLEPLSMQPVRDSWTFFRRQYDIRTPSGEPAILLYSRNQTLSHGENFFIAFKHDMPIGRYRIHIRLRKGAQAYIGLSLIRPGDYEQLYFYRETNDQAG